MVLATEENLLSISPFPHPDIATHLNPYVSYNVVPQFYHTPPYLHAIPEVAYHRLTPRDRFLVIASDGLWDEMTPSQVSDSYWLQFVNG